MQLGFIGLGVMGAPMATHLVRAGHHLTLHDASPDAAQQLADRLGAGAVCAPSPAAVAEASDIIITMLPNGRVVQEVVLGEAGVIQGIRKGALLLDTSSAEPWLTRATGAALGQKGATMVDAPVSGAQWGAEAAELVFMVGADAEDLERVRPLLGLMGRKIFHLGGLGSGHAMKCLNNCITALTLSATSEALVAGKRYGLDPAAMVDVLNESTGGSWISKTHFHQRIFNRRFDDPFRLELMLKDIGIALRLAEETDTPAPLAALGHQLWRMADQAMGRGASISELVRWVEQLSDTALETGRSDANNDS